ncbi:unnamed protein product, partial [Allacma fusca]
MQGYYYNNETENCELFYYGGCDGNTNNFESLQQCSSTCKTQMRYPDSNRACMSIKCPRGGISHYRELGCRPIYDDGACCPTRFDCPDRKMKKNLSQCVYNGKLYAIGEDIPEADSGTECRGSCTCTSSGINCTHVKCADLFGKYPNDNCRIALYKKGECCAYDYGCGNETTICNFEGRRYIEGEKIYPHDEPCLICYCKPGFNGSLSSEFCDAVDCGIQIWYSKQMEQGCSPVYYLDSTSKLGCCPVSWHCPEASSMKQVANESLEYESIQSPENETVEGQHNSVLTRIAEKTQVVSKEDSCRQPKETGGCMASRSRYFYNNETKRCEEFTYSGCKGNLNNFITFQDCLRTCTTAKNNDGDITGRFASISLQAVPSSKSEDPCTQEVSPGRCRAFFARFYFNPAANRCQFFIYGGCGRNDNNFKTKESCEATCLRSHSTTICTKKPLDKIMNCGTENIQKYYFDAVEGRCKQFVSSGCSTETFFTQLEECVSVCHPANSVSAVGPNRGEKGSDICNLPVKTGSCYANIPSYYYDSSSNTCKHFLYGGCFVANSRVNFNDAPIKKNITIVHKRNAQPKILLQNSMALDDVDGRYSENEDTTFSKLFSHSRSIHTRSVHEMVPESPAEDQIPERLQISKELLSHESNQN